MAVPITIGSGANKYNFNQNLAGYTWIDVTNPVSAAGIISSVNLFFKTAATGVKVGIFYGNIVTGFFTCRGFATLGNVTAGSPQIVSVNLNVLAGDYIGIYAATGTTYLLNGPGGSGVYNQIYDQTGGYQEPYNLFGGFMGLALGGSGFSGLSTIPVPSNPPNLFLSWSDDGGHTWTSDYAASIGLTGQRKTRVIWRRLGYSKDRIFRIMCADRIKKRIIGANVE